MQLYRRHKIPPNIHDLAALKWYKFSKQQLDLQKLPPISEAFLQKVIRAHYTAIQWKSPYLPSPSLPGPGEYGWKWDSTNSLYKAVTTTLSPALEKIIHLTVCNCKTSCVFLRCKCRKSGLNCSELCRFDDCHNDDKDEFVKAVDQDMGRVLNTELLL